MPECTIRFGSAWSLARTSRRQRSSWNRATHRQGSWRWRTPLHRVCAAKESIGRFPWRATLRWYRERLCSRTPSTRRKQRSFWNTSRRKRRPSCFGSTDSRARKPSFSPPERQAGTPAGRPSRRRRYIEHYGNRLASILADAAVGDHGIGRIAGAWSASRLVDCIFPLALEILDRGGGRSEEHTSELQSLRHLVCRLL